MTVIAKISDLSLRFGSGPFGVQALDSLNLEIEAGSILGIVGESGSGKSTLAFAMGRLLPQGISPQKGTVHLFDENIWELERNRLLALRQNQVRYVFQDPIGTLDPTRRIGTQVAEAVTPRATKEKVRAVLERVGMPDPDRVMTAWPHELSGGMAQRVAIAIALIAEPRLLIADEATSALDASVRIGILDLLRSLTKEFGITLVMVSHDLTAVRTHSDKVAVMYAGRIVEYGPTHDVFDQPAHPYTGALLRAMPGNEKPGEELATIPGMAVPATKPAEGCMFASRCVRVVTGVCETTRPETEFMQGGRSFVCHKPEIWERTQP